MSKYLIDDTRKVTTLRLKELKAQGKKIAMLTSYDYTMAKLVDEAGVDVILVGTTSSPDFPNPTLHTMASYLQKQSELQLTLLN